jgi:hypothetical protein
MARRRTLTVFGYAAGLIVLLVVRVATAQDLSARGDADCSVTLSAADVVASVRAFGNASVCDNDDCDRDAELTPDDVDCAARCLFGECPIPAHAPRVTAVDPETSTAISPFATIRVSGSNFDLEETSTRVTIGAALAEVVEVLSPDEIVVLVPPLPPGPAVLRVQAGEIAGFESIIDISAQTPVGDADTFAGTLELLDQMLALFAQLDLDEAFGEDAEAVREAIQVYRDEIAAQRLALADDPDFTAELEAVLDAGMDSAGVADELRQLIADIQTLLPLEAIGALDGQGAGPAVGAATIARRIARTVAIARGVITAGGTAVATGASVPTGLVAVGAAVVAGVLTLAGSAALPPIIVESIFLDRQRVRTNPIHVGGAIRIRGHRLVDTQLVIRTALGEFTVDPETAGDDFRQFALPQRFGFCGFVDFYLKRQFLAGTSARVRWGVQPEVTLFIPDHVDVGAELILVGDGSSGCKTHARYTRSGSQFPFTGSDVRALQSNEGATRVPSVPTGEYSVDLYVDGIVGEPLGGLTIFNPLSGVQVVCAGLEIGLAPFTPNRTTCTAKPIPATAQPPVGSRFVWTTSDTGTAGIEDGGAQVQVVAAHPGTTLISAELKLGDEVLATTPAPVTITVRDLTSPGAIIRSDTSGPVAAGASIPVIVRASDNESVSRIVLRAMGDAVVNPVQEFPCARLEEDCEAEFTVHVKEMGFASPQITIVADIFDGAGNQGTSNELAFTIEEDTTCPTVAISSPANGSTVNADSGVQVVATATDDVGVKTFRYTASGDALVAEVRQEITFPMALPAPDLRFNFAVKTAEALRDVTNRTIVVTVEAFDAKGNTCGAQAVSVSVIGTLDQCQGSISVDNPAGYIGDAFTVTVNITGDVVADITRVTSINPGGNFDLAPRGNGVYQVTLFYQGLGRFTLAFTAFDAGGVNRCSGSIGLESLGPEPS